MRPTFRTLVLSAALPLAVGCGGSPFFIEAETEEICTVERDITFPAALPGTTSVQHELALPIGDTGAALPSGDLESEVHLKVFDVTVTGGNPDLRGIERAQVSLRPLDPAAAPIFMAEYRRPEEPTQTTILSLTESRPVDVLELARQESLTLTFEAYGTLPPQEWTVSARACVGVRTKVEYFDLGL